jgi:hypothetical protein
MEARPAKPVRSRNDVGRELVLDEGNAIPQEQFALLQALHLKQIGARGTLKRPNRSIEVAVLLQQARKLRAKLAFFLWCHVPQQVPPGSA